MTVLICTVSVLFVVVVVVVVVLVIVIQCNLNFYHYILDIKINKITLAFYRQVGSAELLKHRPTIDDCCPLLVMF